MKLDPNCFHWQGLLPKEEVNELLKNLKKDRLDIPEKKKYKLGNGIYYGIIKHIHTTWDESMKDKYHIIVEFYME